LGHLQGNQGNIYKIHVVKHEFFFLTGFLLLQLSVFSQFLEFVSYIVAFVLYVTEFLQKLCLYVTLKPPATNLFKMPLLDDLVLVSEEFYCFFYIGFPVVFAGLVCS